MLGCWCKGRSSVPVKVGCIVLVTVLVSVLHLFGAHQCKGNWKMHSWKLGKLFGWLTELDGYISTAGFALFGLRVSVTEFGISERLCQAKWLEALLLPNRGRVPGLGWNYLAIW